MTIQDFLKQTWTHITITPIINKNGTILTVPEINIKLTIGILTTNDKQEFEKLCFALAPVGTIIEPLDDDYYTSQLLLSRNYINVRAISNDRETKRLIEILERRDKEHWSKESSKTVEVKNNPTDNTMTIKFEVKE